MHEHADELMALLQQVPYPTTKVELIAAATGRNLPAAILERLEALPGEPFEHPDEVGRALAKSRASSNPTLVAITAEPCEKCGFPRKPGEPHSCIEEKARFAESANSVTDEFDTLDEGRS
jgi:hypothetical protein